MATPIRVDHEQCILCVLEEAVEVLIMQGYDLGGCWLWDPGTDTWRYAIGVRSELCKT